MRPRLPVVSIHKPRCGRLLNPGRRRCEYDADRGNGILNGIGWADTDEDGIREDREGNEIAFSLITNTGNTVREKVGTLGHPFLARAHFR